MREAIIDQKDLETWAATLLDHSLGGITSADRVMIKGERACWPLMATLERRVIEAGGIPDVLLVPPNNDRGKVWSASMARHGSPEQLAAVPEWHLRRYESMTKYVEVMGAESPDLFANLEAAQLQALANADRPYFNLRIGKPWVITLYPTPGFASLEGLDLDEYTRFLVGASTVDPRPLLVAEQRLAPLVERARRAKVVTFHPGEKRELSLTFHLEVSRAKMSYGLRNLPDGEVYTTPDARGTEGEIFIDLPVSYAGNDIRGIHLVFEQGRIVRYSAEVGQEQLAAIIETDAGSHRVGELALGMNPGIDRVLKHPLLVEKVGGTLHIAIGQSLDEGFVEDPASEEGKRRLEELLALGARNRSALHVDIVADFRPGGCGRHVFFDDHELVIKDGVWTPE